MISIRYRRLNRPGRPLAVVLGVNEIASAVAVRLHRAGHGVVMCHDPAIPVIRRGMAFADAIHGDPVVVDGVAAMLVEDTVAVRSESNAHEAVAVTRLGVSELIVMGTFDALVDARMHKRGMKPDLRNLARVAVGLGPGFAVGQNCDVAVETRPVKAGNVIAAGRTEDADGISRDLGGVGRERFVYSAEGGRWRTALDVGRRVFKGFPLGRVGGQLVTAPFDGLLRGIVRDDLDVPAGVKLVEIDPRGRHARWTGIDERGRVLAEATLRAMTGTPGRRAGRSLAVVSSR